MQLQKNSVQWNNSKNCLQKQKKEICTSLWIWLSTNCSDQHEWFQKALADPEGEYADYFYFRKGKNGNPPSNYRSYFGGRAEPVPGTDLYYLHMFAKEQPDLNWENPVVRKKLYEMQELKAERVSPDSVLTRSSI